MLNARRQRRRARILGCDPFGQRRWSSSVALWSSGILVASVTDVTRNFNLFERF